MDAQAENLTKILPWTILTHHSVNLTDIKTLQIAVPKRPLASSTPGSILWPSLIYLMCNFRVNNQYSASTLVHLCVTNYVVSIERMTGIWFPFFANCRCKFGWCTISSFTYRTLTFIANIRSWMTVCKRITEFQVPQFLTCMFTMSNYWRLWETLWLKFWGSGESPGFTIQCHKTTGKLLTRHISQVHCVLFKRGMKCKIPFDFVIHQEQHKDLALLVCCKKSVESCIKGIDWLLHQDFEIVKLHVYYGITS